MGDHRSRVSALALLAAMLIGPVSGQAAPADTLAPAGCPAPTPAESAPLLHVPSPDWRDQIIYFAMIDRFADGDPCNNDQHRGEYARDQESHFNGGDLAGLTQKLDYIKGLGATTLWITPPVANQWWDPLINYGGYHGYWARDFSSVDEHFGTFADYQRLSSGLHRRGMYLMQDIVVNHVGNFFAYGPERDPADPAKGYQPNDRSAPTPRPTQAPFDLNDPRRAEDRAAGIYHWTPDVSDTGDRNQELTYQSSGLDDIATENPRVVAAFKRIYADWVRRVGVDAYRIDTVKYVAADFYARLLHDPDGVAAAAAATGRRDFLTLGEIYTTSDPLADGGERSMRDYLDSPAGKRIAAPLGYPLYKEIDRVFARGAPTRWLSYRLRTQQTAYPHPALVGNFIDNHDVERFLTHGDERGFRLAYVLLMTTPGIPVIYQGDEQGFRERRQAMFEGGHASDRDWFDTGTPLYRHIQALAQLRRANKLFSRGSLETLADNPNGAGVFAFARQWGGARAYVILNTADHPVLLNRLPIAGGARLETLFAEGYDAQPALAPAATLTRVLPPKSALILRARPGKPARVQANLAAPVIERIAPRYVNQDEATIAGRGAVPGARLLRVIDGDIADALPLRADAAGRWRAPLPVKLLGTHRHRVEIFAPDQNVASPPRFYEAVYERADLTADVSDPAGDARGPTGGYTLPTNPTFGCQMDLRRVSARASGAVLELTITPCAISTLWNPLNGFDHASFNIYFSLPGASEQGATALPSLDARFPGDGRWQIAHEIHGWGNLAFRAEGSSAQKPGAPFTYAPEPRVDRASGRLVITYDGTQLGVRDWAGARIYVTSWDRDGGDGSYRRITPKGSEWSFGGAPEGSPRILDDAMLTLAPTKTAGK